MARTYNLIGDSIFTGNAGKKKLNDSRETELKIVEDSKKKQRIKKPSLFKWLTRKD